MIDKLTIVQPCAGNRFLEGPPIRDRCVYYLSLCSGTRSDVLYSWYLIISWFLYADMKGRGNANETEAEIG